MNTELKQYLKLYRTEAALDRASWALMLLAAVTADNWVSSAVALGGAAFALLASHWCTRRLRAMEE